MILLNIALSLIISYLIGSIPTAYIAGRLKGIDIRQHGSGNVGATNAFRVLGKVPGSIVLLIDVAKGIIPVTLIGDAFGLEGVLPRILLAICVVVGHNWTIFLNFKGGKGMATSLGVLIGLTFEITAIRPVLGLSVLLWGIVFLSTGFVSLASVIAAVFLPVWMIVLKQSTELIVLGIIFCVFIVLRHRSNIERLLKNQESRVRFSFFKKSPSS
ncbi:MAG: glycerol-3-phosphate 1-O-acyltransferase PlsY [Candidatus Omnitrophota bacterium]